MTDWLMAIPRNRNRTGGPRTPGGKASCAKNALTIGIASLGWREPSEQAEYEELVAGLAGENPSGTLIALLIERIAAAVVMLRRLQRVENAEYGKARLMIEHLAAQRPENSAASFLPDTPDGQQQGKSIMVQAAMPSLDRLDTLARYQTMLQKQFSRLQTELRVAAGSQVLRPAAPNGDIVDVTVNPVAGET